MVFLVDYENVHASGLEGIENLKSNDEVIIFYSVNATNIPLDMAAKIKESLAKVIFKCVDVGHANALDFKLVTYLFCGINRRRKYAIISKDLGYREAIEMASELNYGNVAQYETIAQGINKDFVRLMKKIAELESQVKALSKEISMAIDESLGVKNTLVTLRSVQSKIVECEGLNELYQDLISTFGNKKGADLYRAIKPNVVQFKSLNSDIASLRKEISA